MDLLINTFTAWYEPPRARHQLATALSKYYRVIFVARNENGNRKLTVEKINDNLILITPSYPVDYRLRYRIPLLNELYQKWLYSKLQEMYPEICVINFDFTAHKLNSYFKNIIYYCNDEYIGNGKYSIWLVNQYHKFCERLVIRNAKFNVATSKYLKNKLQSINSNTHEILLGANEVNLPADYNGIAPKNGNSIRIGLMGVINCKQISFEVINELTEDKNFALTIIGPVEDSFYKNLIYKDRIKFTGPLQGKQLIEEMMQLDIGLAIYNNDLVNLGATPNKLWQYLSVGKPVIISNLPNLDAGMFPADSVYVYSDINSVRELIYNAYSRNSADLAMERISFSRKNSWDSRVMELIKLMNYYSMDSIPVKTDFALQTR